MRGLLPLRDAAHLTLMRTALSGPSAMTPAEEVRLGLK